MNIIWTRTLLKLWKKSPAAIANLDKAIESSIVRTMKGRRDAFQDIESIRQLILRKKNLQYILLIIDEVMEELSDKDSAILNLRYSECKPFWEISEILEKSMRTTFRCYDTAMENMSKAMIRLGYSASELEDEFEGDMMVVKEYLYQANEFNKGKTTQDTVIIYRTECEDSKSKRHREVMGNYYSAKYIEN